MGDLEGFGSADEDGEELDAGADAGIADEEELPVQTSLLRPVGSGSRFVPSSIRMQAAACSVPTSRIEGIDSRHACFTRGHRDANRQPSGRLTGLGNSPASTWRSTLAL